MTRLLRVLVLHIGSTLAGGAVVLALALGVQTLLPIGLAATTGFLAAFPVSWIVAHRIADLR